MSVTGPIRDVFRRNVLRRDTVRVDADRLIARIEALDRFAAAASPHISAADLHPATAVVERAGGRLALSRDHTVVALAGATGSGKSSLFNVLAGADISATGVRRPVTGVAHAILWPDPQDPQDLGAGALLDWLGIPPDHRFSRRSSPDDPRLAGLVLLDLPDFDSVEAAHRIEADRLLRLVDLVVWVTDPQKYADQIIHQDYLRSFHKYAANTVVVLNQADRLSEADLDRCLADLSGLLAGDGMADVPVFPTSATTARGTDDLRDRLRGSVSARLAWLQRLWTDVDIAVESSGRFVGAEINDTTMDSGPLAAALASSAGVPAVTEATEKAYRFRAKAAMGWPLVRWIRRVRTDPLTRLRVGMAGASSARGRSAPASSLPRANAAQRSIADLAVRDLGTSAARGLPPPWPAAIVAAARSRESTLPDELDQTVVTTDLGMDRRPWWWRATGIIQWLLTALAIAGGLWLILRIVLLALGVVSLDQPGVHVGEAGRLPFATLALVGGALAGILVSLLVKPAVSVGARRAAARAGARLREAIGGVARDQIVAPVRAVLEDYRRARAALVDAGWDPR